MRDGPAAPSVDAMLVLTGAALLVVGSVLPWATASVPLLGSVSIRGTDDGHGYLSIVLAVPLIVFAVRRLSVAAALPLVWTTLVAGVALVLSFVEMTEARQRVRAANRDYLGIVDASVGVGLWVLAGGAAIALAGALVAVNRRRTRVAR